MKKTLFLLAILSFPLLGVLAQTDPVPSEARIGYEALSPSNLRAYEAVLTADSLEGRETTYPGQKKAAEYIASHFRDAGLKPIGDDGTFFQHFNVHVTRLDPQSSVSLTIAGQPVPIMAGRDYTFESLADTVVTGSVAFVGHTNTELNEEDRSLLAGRILFVLIGKRELAGDTSREQYARRLFAPRREPGAGAIFLIADDRGPASMTAISRITRAYGLEKGRMSLDPNRSPRVGGNQRFFISSEVADRILRASGHTLAEWRATAKTNASLKPILIDNVSLTVNSHILREVKQTENVVGLLDGGDPQLKKEVVAFTGHFDHLGKNSAGQIYHGADDDGSGTSMIIELAHAFSKNPVRPKRSLLFMTVVGEEKGLLGSDYYTTHPLIPLDRTIADLNIDMIGRVDSAHAANNVERYVYVIGSDRISTELDSLLVVANTETEQLQLDYTYNDPNDRNDFYHRSDHYNFARFGVPVIFFFTGVHQDYHQPTDTADKILYDRMNAIGRLVYATGWKLGNMPRMLIHTEKASQAK
jgi:hypothetical protein